MFKGIDYIETKKFKKPIFIDLRSEGEFLEATIPGSINMPVLSNEERKIVGTVYVEGDVERAKVLGVGFMSKKLDDYYKKISHLSHEGEVVLFCSRGGYRSTVFFNLLKSLGQKVYKLNFGYKGYRRYIIESLEEEYERFNFVNLKGYTGCGKTEILKRLEKVAQVLDLEGLANHRGSSLGHVGMEPQPSQKMFESLIYEKLESFSNGIVFVESESTRIGSLIVPKKLYDAYTYSKDQVLVNSPMEYRVKRILEEYTGSSNFTDEILEGLNNLKRYISEGRYENYLKALEEKNYEFIIEDLIVKYYDMNYSIKGNYSLVVENTNSEKAAKEILSHFYPS